MDVTDLELRSEEVARFLRQEVQGAPYRTLVMALIAGYVLGGRAMAGNFVAAALRGTFDERWRIG